MEILFKSIDNKNLDDILDRIGDAICISDKDFVFKGANRQFANFYGLKSPEEIIGKSAFKFYPEFKKSVFYEACSMTVNKGTPTTRIGFSNNLKTWIVIRCYKYDDDNYVMIVHKLNEEINKIGYVSHYDSLTSLPNRHMFEQDIAILKNYHQNTGALLIDLQQFGKLNEKMGISIGDMCLMEVAARIKKHIASSDRLYRTGGDQFLVLSSAFKDDTTESYNKIKEAFEEPFALSGKEYLLNICVGFAHFNGTDIDAKILNKAEIALAYAKKQKINYAEYRLEMEDKNHNIFLSKEIKDGLKNNEFELFLQPQADIIDNRICGAEILVRWKKPEGYKPPFSFLPFAEETGLIVEIDKYIVSHAMQMIGSFNQQDINLPISINLSAQSISSREIVEHFVSCMKKYGVAPEQVCIEITETSLMTDINTSKEVIGELRNLGIKIAIDDFGTGYSSMEYLVRYPSDYLKIDREFIKDMIKSDNHKTMVGNLIKLGHGLGISIVAEGVENQEEWDILKNYNCDMVQGFFYAKPMPLADFMKEIEKRGISDMKSSLI
jgi:diguanylate cyclase (GGDEF)-like protein